jgi:hypothetical protein
MIKILLVTLFIFPLYLGAQTQSVDTILWSSSRLAWSNYKGKYDTAIYKREYLAITAWKIVYQYRPLVLENKLEFIIYAWFDANKSWVRKKANASQALLLHEQGHFDLAELLARQFRQQLLATIFIRTNYADSIKQIFSRLLTTAYATQEKYDAETVHGTNSRRQAYWQVFIASELKRLEGFQNKNIKARLVW